MAEGITGKDGKEKRDCEHEAGKRLFLTHGQEYRRLKPALLGDDLYSDQTFCLEVLKAGMSFLFARKPDSHPRLTETV
jgi:hypothetical protein